MSGGSVTCADKSSTRYKEFNSFYFEVHSSGDFGRYLVAKEDIDEKTLILSEIPIVFGPTDDKDFESDIVFLFCLACCKQLYPNDESRDKLYSDTDDDNDDDRRSSKSSTPSGLYYCSKCGWPVCDMNCEKNPIHSNLECKFFTLLHHQRSTYPPPHLWLMYKSVIVLRLLLLIQQDREKVWDNFLEKLEHHTEIRESKPSCASADEILLQNLEYFTEGIEEKKRNVSKKNSKKKYNLPFYNDKSMLKRIIGTMNVNSFCANNNSNKRIARCMFATASLFAHSCAPNCSWTIQISDFKETHNLRRRKRKNGVVVRRGVSSFKSPPQIQIYSSVPIKKGEIVTIPYSTRNIFYGTLKRQILMESVGHFICKCRRCMDPTELGTFMSSIRCFKCENGFLVPVNPSDEESQWVCSKGSFKPQPNDKSNGEVNDSEETSKKPESCCGCKCSVGKVVYFVTKVQDKVDRIRSRDLDWIEEQEELHQVFEKYCGNELYENHYLLFEISTRMVELLDEKLVSSDGTCEELKTLGITSETWKILVNRFLFHVKHMIKIADTILPGYNHYQDQIQLYLQEAESLKCATIKSNSASSNYDSHQIN